MADEADCSDEKVMAPVLIGIKAAEMALKHRQLLPVGVCHYCESPVAPKQLFCPADTVEPEQSCSVQWEYEQRCRRLNNR